MALVNLAVESEDGRIDASDVASVVESELHGFHSHALEICYKLNANPRTAVFPLETFCKDLSDAKRLDFQRLWSIVSESPDLDRLQIERLAVYNLTSDPHPVHIFNLDQSTWFRSLLSERIDVDHYHCTYTGSYHFAEVGTLRFRFIR